MKAEYPKFFNQNVSFLGISRESLMVYGIILGAMSIFDLSGFIKTIGTAIFFILVLAKKKLKRGFFRHSLTSLRKDKYYLIHKKEELNED